MSKLNKPRLGRGLSSLISVGDDDPRPASFSPEVPNLLDSGGSLGQQRLAEPRPAAIQSGQAISLSVNDVRSNPHQPRREFSEAGLKELAASLKTNGLIQPIVVRQLADGYELIAGERRLRAAKLAGLSAIPAIVKEADGMTQAQWALVENIQREDLNPIDRAQAYQTLLQQLGLSHAELANRLGEDRSTISNHLRLLELAVPVRELLRKGLLSLGHAKVLAGVSDVLEQERLGNLAVQQGLSVRNVERLVQATPATDKTETNRATSAHIKGLEKSIAGQLGMRANVKSRQNGTGKLIIHYASLDQFDELMGKLGVSVNEGE